MDAAKELGMEVVQAWRNSLKARPPPMKVDDEEYPGRDRRNDDLTKEQIPLTESLMDCMERGKCYICMEHNEIKSAMLILIINNLTLLNLVTF